MPPHDSSKDADSTTQTNVPVEHGATWGRWIWDAAAKVVSTRLDSGDLYDFNPFVGPVGGWAAHLRGKSWMSSRDLDDLQRAFLALEVAS